MIFQKEHIDQILNGTKTQTRRIHKGKYQEGRSYAIQPCRICKGIEGYRIVMDRIWEDFDYISKEAAWAEGGYTPEEFENVFTNLNPKWHGGSRWVFEYHVIENKISKEEQQKLERSLKHLHQEITEHIHPYVTTKIGKVQR